MSHADSLEKRIRDRAVADLNASLAAALQPFADQCRYGGDSGQSWPDFDGFRSRVVSYAANTVGSRAVDEFMRKVEDVVAMAPPIPGEAAP